MNRLLSNFHRFFWSIYFAAGIAVIGLTLGYFVTSVFFGAAFLVSKIPGQQERAESLRRMGEWNLVWAIRILLSIQPWLRCKTNLHPINGFFDQFPSRRVMFVGNHRSNLDTFLMISYVPGLRGLAKSSLYSNVFFAPMMWMLGFIPVQKNDMNSFIEGLSALKEKVFDLNRPVLMFPENKRREKQGPPIEKFSASSFAMAKDAGALIVPVAIQNTERLMGRGDLFVNPFEPVTIKQLPVVDPAHFSDAFKLRDFVHEQIRLELQ